MREHIEDGHLDMDYINTNENVADVFTKVLGRPAHAYHQERLLGEAKTTDNDKNFEDSKDYDEDTTIKIDNNDTDYEETS
jgi:hypothetical protein